MFFSSTFSSALLAMKSLFSFVNLFVPPSFFFKLIKVFFKFFFFLAALGLRCCAWAFTSCSEQGPLMNVVHGLLIAVASPVVEHRL